jgi:two-component system chemotaxis response regulator CheY
MRILIVDDSTAMRRLIVRSLRQAQLGDHTYLEARDGAEGLLAVDAHAPDLVLSDWHMPVLDGMQFLRAFRARGHTQPFGFVTVDASDQSRACAEAAGADFVIAKPFGAEAFAQALGDVLV